MDELNETWLNAHSQWESRHYMYIYFEWLFCLISETENDDFLQDLY